MVSVADRLPVILCVEHAAGRYRRTRQRIELSRQMSDQPSDSVDDDIGARRTAVDLDPTGRVERGDDAVGDVLVRARPVDAGVAGPDHVGREDGDETTWACVGDREIEDRTTCAEKPEIDDTILAWLQRTAHVAGVENAWRRAAERDEALRRRRVADRDTEERRTPRAQKREQRRLSVRDGDSGIQVERDLGCVRAAGRRLLER